MKILFKAFVLFFSLAALSLIPATGLAQNGKSNDALKAGVSYVWLSDYDSQGLMFSNSYSHYFTKRVAFGLNLGMLSASRYDQVEKLYTIKNTFMMGSLDVSIDALRNESIAVRLGAGAAARHRAEINSNVDGTLGTHDGQATHIKTSDVGFTAYLENDFNFMRYGIAGGRIGYYQYATGTPVLAFGMHIGFSF